jgi:hypothetical protein
MTKASDNAFPSILVTEGTEPSAPAAGKQRLYIDSTSHKLKRTDSSGTDVTIEGIANPMTTAGDVIYGGASGVPTRLPVGTALQVLRTNAGATAPEWATAGGAVTGATDINIYTGGDITLNNTTLTAVTGPTDLVVAAASGDCLMVGVSARPVTTTGQSIAFDFATMVSGSPVNYIFPGSGTPVNIPVPWFIAASEVSACNGGYPYVVQSGDISGGNVTLRLYFRSSGSRVIEADAAAPLVTWVHNLKQ